MSKDYQANIIIKNREVLAQKYTEIRDPGKLNEVVGMVAVGGVDHVNQTVLAADQAFRYWRKVSVEERIARVLKAGEIIKESMPDLAPLLSREHGGLLKEANMDFMAGYANFKNYANVVPDFMRSDQSEDEANWISIEKKPKGVVAAIVPWNMPIVLTMMKLVPALMTGNTIVVKPSPNSPLALTSLLKRMASCLPEGVINVVQGGADVGEMLIRHRLVKKVSFTGGSITGKKVNAIAAESLKGVTLELGGNDPAIVLEDANLEEVIPRILKAVFTRSGQVCYAIKRLYVQHSIFNKFTDLLCSKIDEYKVGHGLDERSSLGPVNNAWQYDFVKGLIKEAENSGAEVRTLGSKLDPDNWENGYYILPHVVIDINHITELVHCEQFGPIIPITPFRTTDQAIRYANESDYGLAASIWSEDIERAQRNARRLEAGVTFINTHGLGSAVFGMPFGGIKNSGLGRESSPSLTLSAYTDTHALRYVK